VELTPPKKQAAEGAIDQAAKHPEVLEAAAKEAAKHPDLVVKGARAAAATQQK